MAFLFKSRKNPPPSSLPPATRNTHTSDGTTSPPTASLEKPNERKAQSPPPATGANGSYNSLNSQQAPQPIVAPPLSGPAPYAQRQRSDSESQQSRPSTARQAPPHADLYPWSQKQLNFPNSQSNPFPRYGAAVNAMASKDGDIYLMGGLINGSMVRGDLWMVEAGNGSLSCYPIATVSEGPGPRVGHASLLVGNAFIVFGGDTKMDDTDVLDDTLYLLNTSSRQWSRASPPGLKPAGRYGHTLNILGSKIYIFGGQVEGSFYNDLIAFDLNALQNPSNQWEFLIADSKGESRRDIPPARTNHTVVSYNDQLFLFGGTDGTQWFNDVWTYDPKGNRWTQQDCIGYIPAPREGHSAALVNDVMYVFGGRTEHGDDLGDLAAFRISLKRWYTFQNMGPSPSPRSGHSMTAHGKQIVVLAGEPSTAPRDAGELSLVYVLDTAKIRYPNDAPTTGQQKLDHPNSPARKPSDATRSALPIRSVSREGHMQNGLAKSDNSPREGMNGGPVQRPEPVNQQVSRPPRPSQAPAGPPPQSQPPNPRINGIGNPVQNQGTRGKPSITSLEQRAPSQASDGLRQATPDGLISTATHKDIQKENMKPGREVSPSSHGRRTPTAQPVSKAKAMEAGEAAPLVGAGVARQRSLKSPRGHSSVDGSEDGGLSRSSLSPHQRGVSIEHRNSRSFAEEPNSPRITPHQEALMRELEAVKSRNAWYASELALAKKSGYGGSTSPTLDDRNTMNLGDDDQHLVQMFVSMRNELARMQHSMEQQSTSTAKKIAEVEHQRDAAVTEAAYARAKLAAHGGSQRSTPQLEGNRYSDEGERSTDMSRRLALALAAVNEHKAKIDVAHDEISTEKRAREAAEEAAGAAQRRLDELNNTRNPAEIEALKAELHTAQTNARAESGQRIEVERKLRMLEVDHKELSEQHKDLSGQMDGHISSVAALQAAVAASTSKAAVYERQIEDERQEREAVERKLAHLKSEHEDRTHELESTTRRLRETEELADSHAKEASTHRTALMAGLGKLQRPDTSASRDVPTDERLSALREAVENANNLAKSNQEAADAAAQKLRGAEERIAGLEAYQEQSSREGLQIRRQLQSALRDVQTHQNESRELRTHLETHQRNASALAVQHGALKDLLGERGIDMASSRRSPNSDNLGPRLGTPEQGRLREVEQQLQASQKAHEETKNVFESREQEAEKAYRERLEQLENDYQSLLTYVRGTEKMLKKMKEELTKYKTQNQRLSSELEAAKDGKRSVGSTNTEAADWATERDAMQTSISAIRAQMSSQIRSLEVNMANVQKELASAQADRDEQKVNHEALARTVKQRETELAQLKSENSMLETRALDAEHHVTMLLDQVGSSVSNYRRQSQMHSAQPGEMVASQAVHSREPSASTLTHGSVHEDEDARGSLALDNLASELESLRTQWESQSRSYRLSDKFDFERTPTSAHPATGELSDTLASWRRRMDQEDNASPPAAPAPASRS